MRRFRVHFVTESTSWMATKHQTRRRRTTRSISRRRFRTRPRGYRSTQSGTPTSKASRSQKLKLSSSNRRA
jgi:hypothetical protein